MPFQYSPPFWIILIFRNLKPLLTSFPRFSHHLMLWYFIYIIMSLVSIIYGSPPSPLLALLKTKQTNKKHPRKPFRYLQWNLPSVVFFLPSLSSHPFSEYLLTSDSVRSTVPGTADRYSNEPKSLPLWSLYSCVCARAWERDEWAAQETNHGNKSKWY